MTGLNHNFLVIKSGSYSLNNYEEYKKTEHVGIHDDLLIYFQDALAWLSSYNPSKKEETTGLCWYGPTIIPSESAAKFGSILSGWIQILSEAPDIVALTGVWSFTEGEHSETGSYEELVFNKKELIEKITKLIAFCEVVNVSGGEKCLLHLGI